MTQPLGVRVPVTLISVAMAASRCSGVILPSSAIWPRIQLRRSSASGRPVSVTGSKALGALGSAASSAASSSVRSLGSLLKYTWLAA